MALSVFDLYSIGIGPSSSHTVGPMRAAKAFADRLTAMGPARSRGHGARGAVRLAGRHRPRPRLTQGGRAGPGGGGPRHHRHRLADLRLDRLREERTLNLAGTHLIAFDLDEDLIMHRRRSLPAHPNGMTFAAYDASGAALLDKTFYSVGGGFVVDEAATGADRVVLDDTPVKFPFTTGDELLEVCAREGLSISDVMLADEQAWRTEQEIRSGLLELWAVMAACIERGFHREGVLPGGLKVVRRAPALYRDLSSSSSQDLLQVMDWVNLSALAVKARNSRRGHQVTSRPGCRSASRSKASVCSG